MTLLGGRELDAETLSLALQNVMGESWMRTLKRWQTLLAERAGNTVPPLALLQYKLLLDGR